MEKEMMKRYLTVSLIFIVLLVGLVFIRYGSLTGFAVYGGGVEPELTSAMHLGVDRTEVFVLDENYYLADMKDSSKNFYLNFSENLINDTILRIYARQDKGVAIGVYAQSDSSGTDPLGTFTVTSATGEWYNITLSIGTPTDAIWIGEGIGSGADPKDEFDYIYAVNPVQDDTPPDLTITFPIDSATYDYNESINLNYTIFDDYLDGCWYWLDTGENLSLTCGQNTTFDSFEGSHTIYLYANDSLGNLNLSSVTFTISLNSPPTINLVSPGEGNTYGYNESLSLNFSVSDIDGNVDSCWYHIDSNSNVSIVNCQNASFDVAEGSHTLKIYVNDTQGLEAFDSSSFSVNVGAPTITLSSPVNTYLTSYDVAFRYVPEDVDLQVCELWGFSAISFSKNQTQNNPTNDQINQFNLTLSDGNYVWNVKCNDTSGHEAFEGNKTFSIDTIYPAVILTEPNGTKDSRTVGANWTVTDTNLNACWYNVFRGVNVELGNASVSCYSNFTSFDVTLDATFAFNLYANDSAGNLNKSSLNFTVSTSSSPPVPPGTGGGGGGGGGGFVDSGPASRGNLQLSGVSDVVANSGESKTLSLNVKNLGPIFLNNCKLSGTYISSNVVKGLAVGQEEEFVFVLNVPEDFEGDRSIDLTIKCTETEKSASFTLLSSSNVIELELISSQQKGGSFEFVYLVKERAGTTQNINVDYWLENSDGVRVAEGGDSFNLNPGEDLMREGVMDLPDVAGEHVLNIYLSSDSGDISLREPILIGTSAGLIGRAILVAGGGKTLGIAVFIFILAFVVVYVVRRIMRRHLAEDRTGYVKVKLNQRE